MRFITFISIVSILNLAAHPALSQTTTNSLKVESNFARPNESSNIKVTDTVRYELDEATKQSLTVGLQRYSEEGRDPIYIYPTRVDTEWKIDPKAKRSATFGIGLGYNFIVGEDGKVSASTNYSQPLGNRSRAGVSINFVPMFDSHRTIKDGLTRTNISTSTSWDIDKDSRVSASYTLGLISDDNTSHEANLRYQRTVSPGVYVAGLVNYRDTEKGGNGYWTPSNRIAVGPEVGVTIPINEKDACMIIGRATLISENDRKGDEDELRDSSIGAGGGCRFKLDKNNSLEVRVGGGYGVNLSAEYTSRF